MRHTIALTLAAALTACGSVADSDYRGEPLASLRGVVTVSAGLTVDKPIDVSIMWLHEDLDGDGDSLTLQSVAVQGSFPSSFELVLNEPPPSAVLSVDEATGNAFVMGQIVAAPSGTDPYDIEDSGGAISPVGAVIDHVLIWTRDGFAEGSREALYFGGAAIPPGYQLMSVLTPEARLAANPALAECDEADFYAECDEPQDDSETAWQAYDDCAADAQVDAGCWGPESWQAGLVLAPQGLMTEVSLELMSSADDIAWPELD
jgi:hypothetical protein